MVTINPDDVIQGQQAVDRLIAGEVIDAGEGVCNISGTAFLCDANHATAARSTLAGIAVTSALAIGQPVFVQKAGPVTVGADVLEKGLPYFVSPTAGKFCKAEDLTGGCRTCLAGFAADTDTFTVAPKASGVTIAAQVVIATETQGNGSDTNEVQSIVVRYATGGTFTLTFEGQTTAAIAFDANAAAIDSALTALSNITGVDVTGSGTDADPFLVTFTDDFTNQDQMTANIASLLPV